VEIVGNIAFKYIIVDLGFNKIGVNGAKSLTEGDWSKIDWLTLCMK
jgi:hypothetical protein